MLVLPIISAIANMNVGNRNRQVNDIVDCMLDIVVGLNKAIWIDLSEFEVYK